MKGSSGSADQGAALQVGERLTQVVQRFLSRRRRAVFAQFELLKAQAHQRQRQRITAAGTVARMAQRMARKRIHAVAIRQKTEESAFGTVQVGGFQHHQRVVGRHERGGRGAGRGEGAVHGVVGSIHKQSRYSAPATLSEHCAGPAGIIINALFCRPWFSMRILLVEDDPDLSRALQSGLERQGVVADVVDTLAAAASALREPVHQLLLLDRQLPDGDGAAFVATARTLRPNLPVIMLTAKGSLSDKVEGLDVGADDYLVKPVAIEELMARIRAVSRRPSEMHTPLLRLGRLQFDFESLQAQVGDQLLPLPRRQLLVLQALALRQGRTVARSALEEAVYGFDDEIQSNALDAHISKLRKALQQARAGVEIHVIRGVGYLLAEA